MKRKLIIAGILLMTGVLYVAIGPTLPCLDKVAANCKRYADTERILEQAEIDYKVGRLVLKEEQLNTQQNYPVASVVDAWGHHIWYTRKPNKSVVFFSRGPDLDRPAYVTVQQGLSRAYCAQ